MSTCGKCSSVFVDKKDTLVCAKCKKVFHPACSRVVSDENYKLLNNQQKLAWLCDTCEVKQSSQRSGSKQTQDNEALITLIRNLESNLSGQIGQVNTNIDGVKGQLKTVNDTICSLQATLGNLVKENEDRKNDICSLESENAKLKQEVSDIKSNMQNMEQYSRRDNIEIVGIPYTKGENLYSIIAKIATVIQIKYNSWDISIAHRLPVTAERPNPAIIVKFISRECKTAWMNAAFANRQKMTGAALSDSWPSYSFFINDHLTAFNKAILGKARQAVRDKKLISAWSRDCKVFARKRNSEPGSRPTLLRTMEDLEQLLK